MHSVYCQQLQQPYTIWKLKDGTICPVGFQQLPTWLGEKLYKQQGRGQPPGLVQQPPEVTPPAPPVAEVAATGVRRRPRPS